VLCLRPCRVLLGSRLRLGSHGLDSHLVVPPTGNPPIGLVNRSKPNWDEGPTQLGPQNLVNKLFSRDFVSYYMF
jgi:hypothetical protein